MADSKARPQRTTGYNGGGGATPPAIAPVDPANMFSRPMDYAGASPSMFWSGSDTTPPNANPAAMRGYLRNAPYLEGIINSPESIKEELGLLGYAPEDDVVSQYRKRVLMQALQDIYNINPYLVGPGHALTRGMSQTPDAGYTSTTPSATPGPTTPRGR